MVTVGWTTPEFYDITFAGLRDGGVFIISTLGTSNLLSYDEFIQGYHELRTRFPNSQLICVEDAKVLVGASSKHILQNDLRPT